MPVCNQSATKIVGTDEIGGDPFTLAGKMQLSTGCGVSPTSGIDRSSFCCVAAHLGDRVALRSAVT